MSGIFGNGQKEAQREAAKQAGQARRERQTSNEEANRAQQRGERGSGSRGRDMLIGNLSQRLRETLGG